jgi:branched-chain amino acid transport system substrate-binding protein
MNMMRRLALALGAFLVVLHVPTACSDEEPSASATTPIEIGSLVAQTGDLSGSGKDNTEAAALAVEQINQAGGVLGRKLRLVVEDDKTTVEGARTGYTNLIAKKVAVVVGPSSSAQVAGVADLIAASRTLTIGRTSTSPLLTTIADDDFFFRIAPSDEFQAKVVAKLVKNAGLERLCVVHREDTYGGRLADALVAELGPSGPVVVRSAYNPSLKDLSFVLPKCDALRCSAAADGGAPDGGTTGCSDDAKVGLVMITFITDGKAILDSAPDWSASKQRLFFTDGARDVELVKLGLPEDRLEGARGTIPAGPALETPEGQPLAAYRAAFQARYGAPAPAFAQNAFEAVYVAATAIEIAGTTDGLAVRDAVRKTSTPGGVKVSAGNWQEIRDAIAKKQSIDYRGVSGEVDFDQNGDVKPPYYYRVWRIDRGQSITDAIEVVQ